MERIEGIQVLDNASFEDRRGSFLKLFSDEVLPGFDIHQANFVDNLKLGTMRGLHMQVSPNSEAKKFNVIQGSIQLVCLDLRSGVKSYGSANSFLLNSKAKSVLVPAGCATGYLTLDDHTQVMYFSGNSYWPSSEIGIRWNDPILAGINWEMEPLHVSDKDSSWEDFKLL